MISEDQVELQNASNLDEYIAGTEPQNAASKLLLTGSPLLTASPLSIAWPAVAGKLYRILTSADLIAWDVLDREILTAATGLKTLDLPGQPPLFIKLQAVADF